MADFLSWDNVEMEYHVATSKTKLLKLNRNEKNIAIIISSGIGNAAKDRLLIISAKVIILYKEYLSNHPGKREAISNGPERLMVRKVLI
ncbi:MAG UNVERIFIED_CONTAM: hypothetical protein LVQ98_01865 [Rickettsiaceae bacterium]